MAKLISLAAMLLAACQSDVKKPERPLDPKDPKSVAEYAAYNTRSHGSYETRFKARIAPPKGDPLDYQGQSVWVKPGVLYIHYTASGGDEKKIVRAGDKVWVYHVLIEDWVTAEEINTPGAGRGIQNPDDVLGVLSQHLGGAKFAAPHVVGLSFSGEDIEKVMKEQAQKGAFDWKKSDATLSIEVDGETRLKKFSCRASLTSTDPNVSGQVGYTAEVEVLAYDGAREMVFHDEQKKPIPLRDDIKKAIEDLKGKK